MLSNRSVPRATVVPMLAYPDVSQAAEWLCGAFGFSVRLRIASYRIQMNAGEGAVILRELRPGEGSGRLGVGHSVMIRIEDADAHCGRARQHGARIAQLPTTYEYGERQHHAIDPAGHTWDFTQTLADVRPEDWGGESGQL